jgi:hypothetical protein
MERWLFVMRNVKQFESSKEIISENLIQFMENHNSSIYSLPAADGLVLSTAQALSGCCIAGGAPLAMFTGEINAIKDWDLFFTSRAAFSEAQKVFEERKFSRTDKSRFSITYTKHPVIVQFVTRWYSSIGEIFDNFDFSVCCVAINGQDICYTKTSAKHIKERKYNLIHTETADLCLKRIARYGEKGFFPSEKFITDFLDLLTDSEVPIRRSFY